MLTKKLIEEIFVREMGNPVLDRLDDGACVTIPERDLVITTDSFVVDPIFFPGGDIGSLAVCGTVNDLAMQGAEPRYLSLGLILEEGLRISDLQRIIRSVATTAKEAGIEIVTGDTKVIQRGREAGGESGLFINTTGIGVRREGTDVSVSNAKPGDAVIVTGTIGDHGMAVLNTREGLDLQSDLVSDAACLWGMIEKALDAVPGIRCLRDPTRGGLAAALCDIAEASGCGIRIREADLPVRKEVTGACDILGLDPLTVANEGKAVIVCAGDNADAVLDAVRSHPLGRDAVRIGTVGEEPEGVVLVETRVGGDRIVSLPTGEDLPRIC